MPLTCNNTCTRAHTHHTCFDPPQVDRQIVAKQAHVEVLRVQNWISSPQRFAVSIERKRADKATTLQGPTYLDVPALSAKDYKLNVYR